MPRSTVRCIVNAILLAAALPAQTAPLSGTWRYGNVGTWFDNAPCGATVNGDRGTFAFAANGTFAMVATGREICSSGAATTNPQNQAGTWIVSAEGIALLDFNPGAPGTDTARLFVNPARTLAVHAPDQADGDANCAVVVKLSANMSSASLTGSYHVLRWQLANAGGPSAVCDLGVAVFDGIGSFTESGSRRTATSGGIVATNPYTAPAASYAIAPDGTFTTGTALGAVASNGEVFFAASDPTQGSTVSLLVGVRRGTGLGSGDLDGAFGTVGCLIRHGTGATLPQFNAEFFRPSFEAAGPGVGSFRGEAIEIDVDPNRPNGVASVVTIAGSYAIAADGGVVATTPVPPPLPMRLSSGGSFLLGRVEASATTGVILGLSLQQHCRWPLGYGTATPGTGGFAPELETAGGFPVPGNATFALALHEALGGAYAVTAFATAAAPGVPLFGGTAWIDTATMFGTVGSFLSGPVGAPGAGFATLPLGLPPSPGLRGLQFYLQSLVVDAGGPQGFAFTRALDLQLCR